jgi:hypothetical protein
MWILGQKASVHMAKQSEEPEKRLEAILQGAFSGPPTPLKDVPKKNGKQRAAKARTASDASAETARPRS